MANHDNCWHDGIDDLSMLKNIRESLPRLIETFQDNQAFRGWLDFPDLAIIRIALKCLDERLGAAEKAANRYINLFPPEYRDLVRATLSGDDVGELYA